MIAKAFLSHKSQDKPLINAVADALCRRGVITWIDIQQLNIGNTLKEKLEAAIQNQTAFVIFISKEALESDWVNYELKEAIELEKARKEWILPVFLGNPKELITASPLLKNNYMTEDNHVNRIGIPVTYPIIQAIENEAAVIADKLSKSIYNLIGIKDAHDINIAIDQRGTGSRTDEYSVPDDLAAFPTLVFRPDNKERDQNETLTGKQWQLVIQIIKNSLGNALGNTLHEKKVHILGNGQLGYAFLLGKYFNRTNCTILYCYNMRHKTCFSNEGQDFTRLLPGGDDDCGRIIPLNGDDPVPISTDTRNYKKIALYVGKQNYVKDVILHIKVTEPAIPILFIELLKDKQLFTANEEVWQLAANIIALLMRLKNKHDMKTVLLYCDLPFNVLILIAANLPFESNIDIRFMEYRKDLTGQQDYERYTYLKL